MKGQRRRRHVELLCDRSCVETVGSFLDEKSVGPEPVFMRERAERVNYPGRVHGVVR